MAVWDVFRKSDLKLQQSLSTAQVREGVLGGTLQPDDLIRPAGSDQPWIKIAEMPALIRDGEIEPPAQHLGPAPDPRSAVPDLFEGDDEEDEYDPLEEDEEAAAFTFTRSETPHIEELDLAAMVDVAFQMVLFFLVTAATVMYKTLEIPTPNPESQKNAPAQSKKTLDDLAKEFILVEIDPAGVIQVDRRPVTAEELAERLRDAREESRRSAMLLTADFTTPHRNVVAAYDAANEIGLRIALARPAAPPKAGGPAPAAAPGASGP
ncbi:MAG: biopolymer transporter ExbD [Isosphaeraceae bacterium]